MKKKFSLRKMLVFYKKHIFLYIGFLVILVIKACLSFLSAFYVAKVITYMMDSSYDLAFHYALLDLTIMTIYCLLSFANTYFYKNLENRVRFDIQQQLINSALNIKMSYYDKMSSGVIVTRLTSDIDHISERFKSLTEKIVNILRRFSYLIYIFILDIRLGFIVLAMVAIISLIYTVRIHFLSKLKPGVKAQREKVNSQIIETVRAIKDIKTLNCDENILSLIAESQKEFIKKDNFEYYIGTGLCKLTDYITHLSNFLFIVLNIILIKNGQISTAVFYTGYLYKDHTFSLANEIGDFRYKLAECEVCAERLVTLIYPNPNDVDSYGEDTIDNFDGSLSFKNVNFSYVEDNLILKGVSFDIPAKKTVAFVGESGSGKSTISNLLGHLYYKDSGKIEFAGGEISNLSKDFIRNNITVVNQFPYLFNLSIRDNFKMIKQSISDDEIWSLCRKVGLEDFIKQLPLGLDSIVGEAGCQLSGGQKQKLSIARALSRDVKVIIFDEATSSLDNVSQDEIMGIIKNIAKERTVIIIAHRLSTITYADSIILIKDGSVVGQGKHETLLKENNYYKSLYLAQNRS